MFSYLASVNKEILKGQITAIYQCHSDIHKCGAPHSATTNPFNGLGLTLVNNHDRLQSKHLTMLLL